MMRCHDAKDAVGRRIAGEIDPADALELERHQRQCPECATEAALLNATLDSLEGCDAPDPGPEYWDSYGPRLRGRIVDAKRRKRNRTVMALAASVLLVAGLAVVASRVQDDPAQRNEMVAGLSDGPETLDPEELLEALLTRAAGAVEGRRALRTVLEEINTGDPLEIDESLNDLTPEESEVLNRELTRISG